MPATTMPMQMTKLLTSGVTPFAYIHRVQMPHLKAVFIPMHLRVGTTILMRMIVLTITESHVKVPVVEIRVETRVTIQTLKDVLTQMQTTTMQQQPYKV